MQAVLPPDVPLQQVEIWFQDEMRIGQRGTQTRIWARRGTRPRIVRQQQSESAYIFGAVCAQRDEAVGLVLPYANTNMMALTTNLPLEVASLEEVVRLYGLRHWVEQGYKQMKDELGWADSMARNDLAIRRHWQLVCCAFAFCW